MAIQPNKPQNRVFLLVGIVLAAAAAVAVLFAVSHSGGSNVATTNVVVAKTTIAAGTPITADLLSTAALAQGSFPADTYTDPNQAVGKVAPVTLSANIPVTASLFATSATGAPGAAVATHLDITKGYVALAIPASFSAGPPSNPNLAGEFVSVGYYIQPEDHIDIIVDSPAGGQSALRYSFQDVRVLRVGAASATAASGTTAGSANSYIIELPRNQAEIMTALVANRGGVSQTIVRYVLRPQAEWGKRDGTNGFDKPIYEPSTGVPLTPGTDSPVTPATLNGLFPG
ncbi:MAG TPA: RcpC/CpaB family pilus assembly protein [Candidatus Dormibacteraeota bacterium]|nr:RcpC/CpaB family pilus assembly protein [Candidatus Dormibacteraeota bacterium]